MNKEAHRDYFYAKFLNWHNGHYRQACASLRYPSYQGYWNRIYQHSMIPFFLPWRASQTAKLTVRLIITHTTLPLATAISSTVEALPIWVVQSGGSAGWVCFSLATVEFIF